MENPHKQLGVRERRKQIAELVDKSGYYRSSELSELFGVSLMTIRRDIRWLEDSGLVQAVHGGGQSLTSRHTHYSYDNRLEENQLAKQAVAKMAATILQPNTIIALDAGTTVQELACILPTDMNLTVVTNSLPILSVLSNERDIEVISLGGTLLKHTQSFVGTMTQTALKEFRINTLFLGARAIHDGYLYSGYTHIIDVKRALINASEKVILLVDSSKFLVSVGFRMAPLEDIDLIIVDDGIDLTNVSGLDNVEIIQAPITPNTDQQSEN